MQCPYCKNSKSSVDHTVKLTTEILRVRRCDACKRWFETREQLFREITPRPEEPEQIKLFENRGDRK